MKGLSRLEPDGLRAALLPLADGYREWLDGELARIGDPDAHIEGHEQTARDAVAGARRAADAVAAGIEAVCADPDAFDAFRFANQAMWHQRVHTVAIEARRRDPGLGLQEAVRAADIAENRSWRPFQLAFVLLCVPSLSDPAHPERSQHNALADLLFFPTGGGKTEAYLGLVAYTLAMRRMQGVIGEGRDAVDGRDGVAVLMRYTLRLLTAQQFQRAGTLMCSAELLRQRRAESDDRYRGAPFRLGMWVGGSGPSLVGVSRFCRSVGARRVGVSTASVWGVVGGGLGDGGFVAVAGVDSDSFEVLGLQWVAAGGEVDGVAVGGESDSPDAVGFSECSGGAEVLVVEVWIADVGCCEVEADEGLDGSGVDADRGVAAGSLSGPVPHGLWPQEVFEHLGGGFKVCELPVSGHHSGGAGLSGGEAGGQHVAAGEGFFVCECVFVAVVEEPAGPDLDVEEPPDTGCSEDALRCSPCFGGVLEPACTDTAFRRRQASLGCGNELSSAGVVSSVSGVGLHDHSAGSVGGGDVRGGSGTPQSGVPVLRRRPPGIPLASTHPAGGSSQTPTPTPFAKSLIGFRWWPGSDLGGFVGGDVALFGVEGYAYEVYGFSGGAVLVGVAAFDYLLQR